jgi:hypothetical protein
METLPAIPSPIKMNKRNEIPIDELRILSRNVTSPYRKETFYD